MPDINNHPGSIDCWFDARPDVGDAPAFHDFIPRWKHAGNMGGYFWSCQSGEKTVLIGVYEGIKKGQQF